MLLHRSSYWVLFVLILYYSAQPFRVTSQRASSIGQPEDAPLCYIRRSTTSWVRSSNCIRLHDMLHHIGNEDILLSIFNN